MTQEPVPGNAALARAPDETDGLDAADTIVDLREHTLTRIRRALVTSDVTLETNPGDSARGFDPYDSRTGQSSADRWSERRNRR